MRLLAACLLAASGGLARQRLPDGSAPLSPLRDSSEPHQRQSRAFPLPPSRASDSSPVSLSRCRVMASRPRVRVPSLSLSLSLPISLSLSYHPATFRCSPSDISLSLAPIGYPLFSTHLLRIFLFYLQLSALFLPDDRRVPSSRSRPLRQITPLFPSTSSHATTRFLSPSVPGFYHLARGYPRSLSRLRLSDISFPFPVLPLAWFCLVALFLATPQIPAVSLIRWKPRRHHRRRHHRRCRRRRRRDVDDGSGDDEAADRPSPRLDKLP